ncbi:MAG: hypothetical protein RLN83_13700, partial [Balneola sp.]
AGTENNSVCNADLATGDFNGQITVNPLAGLVTDFSYTWFDGSDTSTPTAFTANGNVLEDIPGGAYTVRILQTANPNSQCDTTITVNIIDEVNTNVTSFDLTPSVSATDVTQCTGGVDFP